MTGAVAVGAVNVGAADAGGGIRDWATVRARIDGGWERAPVTVPLPGWRHDEASGLWRGPHDRRAWL